MYQLLLEELLVRMKQLETYIAQTGSQLTDISIAQNRLSRNYQIYQNEQMLLRYGDRDIGLIILNYMEKLDNEYNRNDILHAEVLLEHNSLKRDLSVIKKDIKIMNAKVDGSPYEKNIADVIIKLENDTYVMYHEGNKIAIYNHLCDLYTFNDKIEIDRHKPVANITIDLNLLSLHGHVTSKVMMHMVYDGLYSLNELDNSYYVLNEKTGKILKSYLSYNNPKRESVTLRKIGESKSKTVLISDLVEQFK